jgi:hypothetical protein
MDEFAHGGVAAQSALRFIVRENRMDWYRLVPEELLNSAYRTNLELAWPRQDAINIIDILENNKYTILGVDVWLATDPGPTIPTPFVYDWNFDLPRIAPGYRSSASDFVRTFEWDPTDKSHAGLPPYFNIVASCEG